jgi:putative ABC transport system permease protein
MLRFTFRSLLERKVRLLLSGIAVVLGVAFVSGTFVLTDTMKRFFDDLFETTSQGTAVNVVGTSALGGGASDREPVPQAVLDSVAKVPGVADVIGFASGYAQVVGSDGKAFRTGGAPTFGTSIYPGNPQEALKVRSGRAPVKADEVVVDATTGKRAELTLNQRVKVLLRGPAQTFTVVGFVTVGESSSLGGASLLAFEPATSQRILGEPGTWSGLSIAADPGVDEKTLRDRVAAVLPKGFEALTRTQAVADQSKDLKAGLDVFNNVLLAFGGIALFVGAFLIFNTFSMLVAQRVRELALLRALGARRSQVTRSVLVEAILVGLASSLIGFVLGIGLARAIRAILSAFGIDLPGGETVILPRTFIACLVIGVGVTTAAALIPARRAARVAPVQAMRDSGPAEDRSLRRRTLLGLLLLAGGVAALGAGLFGDGGLELVGLGAALSFLAVATLSPLFARPVVGLLGLPFLRLGAPGVLGRGNAMRSPRRTSATAAALMIGLALVAMVSTFGASVKESLAGYVRASLGADFVLHTDNFDQFSPVVAQRLKALPELDQVAAFRFGKARVNGSVVEVQGVDAKPLEKTLTVKTVSGDLDSIDRGRLAISEDVAASRKLKVGQQVDVVWSRTGSQPMVVGAIYAQNLFAGSYLVGAKVLDDNVTERLLGVVAVTVKEGVTAADARAAVDRVAEDFPNLTVEDQSELIESQRNSIDQLLTVVTGMLVFSVLIAVLGIVNTLALSVVERTRELGLLRAVGLQRRQLRRMIRTESVLIAIYGAVLGVAIGVAFGAALVRALNDDGIDTFAVPITRLLWVFVAAGVAGVIAAALPARRAARLDVLDAIAEE